MGLSGFLFIPSLPSQTYTPMCLKEKECKRRKNIKKESRQAKASIPTRIRQLVNPIPLRLLFCSYLAMCPFFTRHCLPVCLLVSIVVCASFYLILFSFHNFLSFFSSRMPPRLKKSMLEMLVERRRLWIERRRLSMVLAYGDMVWR